LHKEKIAFRQVCLGVIIRIGNSLESIVLVCLRHEKYLVFNNS
jgi:hypothetical protein